mgnify:CR=1 FL=1
MRRNSRTGLGMAILAATAVLAAAAPLPAGAKDIDIHFFRPSLHGGDTLAIQTASVYRQWGWSAGAWMDYGYKPLAVEDGPDIVRHLFVMDLYGNVAFTDRLSVGLGLPLAYVNGPHFDDFSTGDLRLGLKARILGGNGRGFGLALAEDLTFPTASREVYVGDELVTGTTNVILDWSQAGWSFAVNLGFRLKQKVAFMIDGMDVHDSGHQLLLGAGLSAPLICGKLEALGTLEYRTSLTKPFRSEYDDQLDLLVGLRGRIDGVLLTAAGGGSPMKGYGSPVFRGILSVGYEGQAMKKGCKVRPDTDGDGLYDDEDACPLLPGPKELRGCPDRDRDGVIDPEDACPDDPGPKELKGCPDRDRDGVIDREDACPDDPGPKELKGCPDRDKDGIIDREDRCPDQPGLAKYKGCPDTDEDGIPDPDDACPTEPGPPENKGCPTKAVLTETKIEILDRVHFETDKSDLKPVSFAVLDAVVAVMKEHPEIARVRVDGHTDNTGTETHNAGLSDRRAEAVKAYLVKKGIAKERLQAKGFAETVPIATNDTEEGRAQNRRTEFTILERKEAPKDAPKKVPQPAKAPKKDPAKEPAPAKK